MTERWYEGIWLGKTTLSDEHLVMKGDGLVVRARAVSIMGTTFSYEDIDKLRSAPHDPTGTMKQDASIPRGAVEPADLEAENAPPEPRRVRLTTDVVDKFGPSARCTKCRLIIMAMAHMPLTDTAKIVGLDWRSPCAEIRNLPPE